jgi:hypothetical protein
MDGGEVAMGCGLLRIIRGLFFGAQEGEEQKIRSENKAQKISPAPILPITLSMSGESVSLHL